jgi:hypothetical protein
MYTSRATYRHPEIASRGMTTALVLIFIGVFMLVLGTITSYALQESRYGRALYAREQALHIAESGLEYYRWYLAHNPNDLTNGTGSSGPYNYGVSDPEGGSLGNAAITVTGNTQCGIVQSVDITAEGRSNADPKYARTLTARYMRPSVAAYSYLLNSNVWAGPSRTIIGPYFSNGGIRMDGSNNSDVLSAQSTWSCNSNFGCSPTATKNGVFGAGSGSALWKYPVSTINFAGMAASFSNLRTYAISGGGQDIVPASGTVTSRGYHIIFRSNGTYDLYRVTGTTPIWSSVDGSTYAQEYSVISAQTYVNNYPIVSTCGLIFAEDRVWIDGVVHGKVTVVAATPSDNTTAPDVYIDNNITYSSYDGSDGLTVVAEGNVLIPINSPDTMEIHGVFAAPNGFYGRNYYCYGGGCPHNVPSAYQGSVLQTQLMTVGTIVSSGRTGTAWIDGGGDTVSGYLNRTDAYDELQAINPAPFTPAASPDAEFILWREQ